MKYKVSSVDSSLPLWEQIRDELLVAALALKRLAAVSGRREERSTEREHGQLHRRAHNNGSLVARTGRDCQAASERLVQAVVT